MKQSKLTKLLNAFYDEFNNNNFSLSEYVDRRGEDGYFDIEFICYGIYRNRTLEAIETVRRVLKKFALQGTFVDVEPYFYKDYCRFFISNHYYEHDFSIREVA